jgi:hypothetical protein
MKAKLLVRRRVVLSERAFAEIVIWQVPRPLAGSRHSYKYRLAHVVDEVCVMRFDNEAGKGDHLHRGKAEERYDFSSVERLLADFFDEVERWSE